MTGRSYVDPAPSHSDADSDFFNACPAASTLSSVPTPMDTQYEEAMEAAEAAFSAERLYDKAQLFSMKSEDLRKGGREVLRRSLAYTR